MKMPKTPFARTPYLSKGCPVMSVRLVLSRRRGFNLQTSSHGANGLDAVTVARPSRWGNPFFIGQDGASQEVCVAQYRKWIWEPAQDALRAAASRTLKGKNLACWCAAG